MSFDTPVALFVFNRPLLTARVFSAITELRPSRLFLIADGPRDEAEGHVCQATREIVSTIDWDCDVKTNFAEVNLGCKRRMSGGIGWVFSQAEQAILLEDDCLPDQSFFPYCEQLLKYYADDERVMTISGDNFQFGIRHTPHSYYFSAIHHIWGWATWRRAWKHYDVEMKQWPLVSRTDFPGDFVPPYAARINLKNMGETHAGRLDTWDYQWVFACWMRRAMCILPAVNLVSNIGFGPGATHCKKADAFAALPTETMTFPLDHPPAVELCNAADARFYERAIPMKAA